MNLPTSEFAKTEWPTRGPDFNPWHADIAAFMKLVQDNPGLWLIDSELKYLDIRVDTRSGTFIVKDRDGKRVSPDRIVEAAKKAAAGCENLAYQAMAPSGRAGDMSITTEIGADRDAALGVLHRYRQGQAGLAEDALAEIKAILAAAPPDADDERWRSGAEIPSVASGNMAEFVVAVQRARNGKVYSFAATYLNAYRLNYESCPQDKDGFCDGCDDGCPTTGWFSETGDEDDGKLYHPLSLGEGDKLLGWRNLPRWLGSGASR